MTAVLLTSFFKSKEAAEKGYDLYSVAVYQPKSYFLPKLDFFDIRGPGGRWTRPRDFAHLPNPLVSYRDALMSLYRSRAGDIVRWYEKLEGSDHPVAALCCWCPYDKAAQRQLKEWGSFVCHTEVIRQALISIGAEQVEIDDDRKLMKVL
jgi:hypothetical protein